MAAAPLDGPGVDAWLDEDKLLPGQDWKLEISEALQRANAILVCMSEKSVTKEAYVQKELKNALSIAEEKPEGTIFIIPVRLDDCTVPRRIAAIQYVDLYAADGYQKLLLSLEIRARSLGLQLKKAASVPAPSRANSYELASMIKDMLRDDGLQAAFSYLEEREPDREGWFHTEIRKSLQEMISRQDCEIRQRTRAGCVLSLTVRCSK